MCIRRGERSYEFILKAVTRHPDLDRELFTSLFEARALLEGCRKEHNEVCSHSSLEDETPSELFEGWLVY